MVDPLRRRTMQAVKSANTGPELQVRKLLTFEGFRYRLHRRDLPGVPDIVFPGRRKVIFIHGCFWHSHSCRRGQRKPKENSVYWTGKLSKNVERDEANIRRLHQTGWDVLVLWECELSDVIMLKARLLGFINGLQP